MVTLKGPEDVKAIKEHTCNYCSLKIRVGETYERSTHKYDDIYTWKAHKHCYQIADKLKMFDDADEGVTQDFFQESISETYYQLMTEFFTNEDRNKYSVALQELRKVNFRDKLMYVIRHYSK